MAEDEISGEFPRLAEKGFEVTSPEDISYNCIAFAAGDNARWWWPGVIQGWLSGVYYYWPTADIEPTPEVFESVFMALGYERCENSTHEPGFEKVAIYVANGEVRHAARELTNGTWTSKLGNAEDIRHNDVDGVCCPLYGDVMLILRRAVKND